MGVDDGFRSTLGARSQLLHYLYTEYLDLSLLDGDTPQRELREILNRKYSSRGIDVIVAAGSRALRVALHNRKALFSGAPVVFTGVDRASVADLSLEGDVTGTWLRQGWTETLDLARRLQPDIERALVVVGSTPADHSWLAAARQQLTTAPAPVAISYLADRSLGQVLEQVAQLPDRTVVLIGAFQRDATGQDFRTRDVVERIAEVSRAPVYVLQDHSVGGGSVGGHVVSFEAHGRLAADLALRVLRGERPPPTDAGTTVSMFDWRQLRRWGLDERPLPAGSIVLFKDVSVWQRYRWWIVGGVTLLLLQTALIAALLVHRAWRRRAQRALAERLRFETLLSNLSAMFAAGVPATVNRDIERGLRRIVEDLDVDRATLAGAPNVVRRGPGDALLGPRGRDTAPRHDPGRRGAVDRRAAASGPRRPPGAARGPAGGRHGRPAERRAIRHALGRRRPVGRERPDGRLPRGRDRPRAASLAGRARAEAPAAGRRLRERHRAARRRPRGPRERGALPAHGRQHPGHGLAVGTRWEADLRQPAVARLHRSGAGPGAGRQLDHPRPSRGSGGSRQDSGGRPGRGAVRSPSEYRLERRDGEYRWLLDHGAPRRADDGVLLGYVGSAVDITQLRAAQQALLETDLLRSAIFGSLYGHVAALDKHGRIIAVNQAWLRFAVENGGDPARVSIGADYIDVCRDAVDAGDPDAPRVLEAVCTVLAGGTPRQVEYAFRTPGGERWYEMTVEPLRRPEAGVLVTHVDVTRRRQAEEEAQRQRDELAHVLRTTTLGELAASLAHEINQPLAAIVANAQATRRLLDAGRASRPGVVETLNDIVDDAKRASQVIRRLRALFRKEHVEPRPVDVNEVVEDAHRRPPSRCRAPAHLRSLRPRPRARARPRRPGSAPAGPAQRPRQRMRGHRGHRGRPA